MTSKIRHLVEKNRYSLKRRIGGICILVNILVFVIDFVLLFGIIYMSNRIEDVYQENVNLNELSESLKDVQDSMLLYLNIKSSDSLEDFYRDVQSYEKRLELLNDQISGDSYKLMERNIRKMSSQYISLANTTIDAKRGGNLKKYSARYEKATEMYGYITTYINSLNNAQLQTNSENYMVLSKKLSSSGIICMAIMIAVMICNSALTFKILGTIISPLSHLADSAGQVAKGNFDIELIEVDSKDEIATVTTAFNSMVTSIQEYIDQIRINMEREQSHMERELKMEANLKEAELKYLQAQINPHFLFNSLNAGVQLAMMEEADLTYEFIQNMADIFKYTVRKGDEIVTVSEELELVDHYIYVINVRYEGDINYSKSIDESLLNYHMPSMILQPIVENCINHGIHEMEGAGQIHISLYRQDDKVCISVKDNGNGMPSDIIEKVMKGQWKNQSLQGSSNGIGMDNVMERMHLFTNNNASFNILSEGEGKGTEVIIMLNADDMEGKDIV